MLATFCKIGKLPVTRLVSLNQIELSSTVIAGQSCLTRIVSHDRRMIVMVKVRVEQVTGRSSGGGAAAAAADTGGRRWKFWQRPW